MAHILPDRFEPLEALETEFTKCLEVLKSEQATVSNTHQFVAHDLDLERYHPFSPYVVWAPLEALCREK